MHTAHAHVYTHKGPSKIRLYSQASTAINKTPPKPRQNLSLSILTHRDTQTRATSCQISFLFTAIRRRKYESVEGAAQIQANEGRTDTFLEIMERRKSHVGFRRRSRVLWAGKVDEQIKKQQRANNLKHITRAGSKKEVEGSAQDNEKKMAVRRMTMMMRPAVCFINI